MDVVPMILALAGPYLVGSIPVGYIVVHMLSDKDILDESSGRTGGTNAFRAAGIWAGVLTTVGDFLKAVLAVWLARLLTGGNVWFEAAAGFLAIVGHNYSIYLLEWKRGKLKFHGGAGGVPTVGAMAVLWPPSMFISIPVGLGLIYGVGYASVATMSMGLASIVIFLIRALKGIGPWAYVAFGIMAEATLLWALRPNIRRLIAGEERLVGWRAARKKRQLKDKAQGGEEPS